MRLPEPKFNVGQTVDVIYAGCEKTQLYILQIETVTCTAGTQIYYRGRLHHQSSFLGDFKDGKTEKGKSFVLGEVKLREDELREVK